MKIIPAKFTYEDLRQMPDDGKRYEIVEGELVVTPAPKWAHQQVVFKLAEVLAEAVRRGYGKAAFAPTDVVLDDENVVEPDLLFISRERLGIVTEENVRGAPDLVVEVLSERTRERDLGAKLRLYARFGVRFYWVVDPEAGTVRTFELARGGYAEAAVLRAGETLSCALFAGVTVDVAAVFAE